MSPIPQPFRRPHINLGYAPDESDGVNTLPELIAFNARYNPDHTFGLQTRSGDGIPPRHITFLQFHEAVQRASSWLVHSGATLGRTQKDVQVPPVGILLGSDIGIYIYMAALLRLGTPVLCLSARLTPVAIAHLLKVTSPSTLLINGQVHRAAKETLSLLESDVQAESIRIPTFLDALGYEDLLNPDHEGLQGLSLPPVFEDYDRQALDAIIMHSSGTTGLPKPIYHAHAYPLIYAACHRLPEQDEPFQFNVSTLPLYHGFGLLAPSLALSVGMPFVLPPASVIPTARSTVAVLKSTNARSMLSVPSILEDILNLQDGSGLEALRQLDFVAIGGAPMKEPVGEELVAAGVNLLNHWGATEIGAIATIQKIPPGYDWHYLMPRSDIGLKFEPIDPSSPTSQYRLIGQAPGWTSPFFVQDLLERHPSDPNQFRILGRSDDLIVLATGEKVRPTSIEKAVAEHPDVKDVLAFGDSQFSLGLLVEVAAAKRPVDLDQQENLDAFLEELEPFLERGNSFMDKHGKISKEMLVFTREEVKPLLRTDKGSLARKANYAAFDEEIRACYAKADSSDATPFPSPTTDGGLALQQVIRSMVKTIMHVDDFGPNREFDDADFFEAGMDSLQANRLRRAILNSLRVTPNLTAPTVELPPDFCFEHSTVRKVTKALCEVMEGTYLDEVTGSKESRRIRNMEAMAERYTQELQSYADIASRARQTHAPTTSVKSGKVILLTGSTGSLGCMFVHKLATDPDVSKIICLNRPQQGGVAAMRKRQMSAMAKRGATLDPSSWEKVVLREAEISQPDFGLEEQEFAELLDVTHVIHNAWPVNFNRNLASFDSHVKAICNLVRLCLLSASPASPRRLLFASSIAVVGRFPLLHSNGPFEIPEIPLDAENTAEFGYPEAKWVCERLLMAASDIYGSGEAPLLATSSVRIGQMTGPEGSGAWNESEHFPIIVRTSQTLKALPDLDGSLSWIPVNRAASAITEMLFSDGFQPFYHMENPSRQSWSGLLDNLAIILGGPQTPLPKLPFPEWLEGVRALGDDPARNPAFKVLSFLEHDFVRMASGPVILQTVNARADSLTMVKSTALDKRHLEEYVAYWTSVGALRREEPPSEKVTAAPVDAATSGRDREFGDRSSARSTPVGVISKIIRSIVV
ncbi:hypothetical protein JAAARDRAFT_140530 [Jaapia argillacea MUCL 33604]|uniref:Carrier domain-containing protein n=1 Tax=Jaapia argillacea MUCL 33604 TaxID=933084 RepID=A0A067PJS4_9AGAM|nr:hypothetical protein JAAARDRAFT_140530 [Jaapia argillacea MUCL 33604]